MGGKGKKQTIGYKYYLGMHQTLCHGPIDKITRVTVDDREAWTGSTTGGQITVSKPNLFGGESREGGVSGKIDIDMGGPTQGKNSYLLSKLGSLIPAYRGVVSAIFRQCYLGNNPYLKAWRFRGQRVYIRQDGIAQWYPEKAGIYPGIENSGEIDLSYAFPTLLSTDPGYPTPPGLYPKTITLGPYPHDAELVAGDIAGVGSCRADDFFVINGVQFGSTAAVFYPAGTVFATIPKGTTTTLQVRNTINPETGVIGWMHVRFVSTTPIDMNPAHIIRECLTDPAWGLGYTDDDIDEASFTAAADKLFAEGLGISLLWDRQIRLEEFIDEIRRHIDAALYVSRVTGKFVLKLIRKDYVLDDLLLLDENNIARIDDPTRASFRELINSVTVNYWDNITGKNASVTITDPAMVITQGAVINTPLQYPGFTNNRNATIAGQRDLRSLSSPTLKCTIYANSEARGLNIGDAFKLSWARWGLDEIVMRVANIAYGTGRNNQVRIEATQDTFDTPTTPVVTANASGWEDPSIPPQPIPEGLQLAMEVPYYELVQANGQSTVDGNLATNPEVGYVGAASARTNAAINARLWTDAGDGYEQVGTLDFCPTGQLASAITKTQTTFTIANGIDLDEVALGGHFQIDNELLRIDTIDIETGEVTVGRGVLDTVPEAHDADSFIFFWDAYEGFDPTEYLAGEEVDVKITPVSGAGAVSVDAATAKTVTLAQRAYRPYPPGDLRINGDSYLTGVIYEGPLTITWAHRDRIQQTAGTIVDHTAGNIGPEVGTTYILRGYVDGSLVHTESAIAGTTTSWTPAGNGVIRVEVYSERDGVESQQAANHEFLYGTGLRGIESGDSRATEDGADRGTEE